MSPQWRGLLGVLKATCWTPDVGFAVVGPDVGLVLMLAEGDAGVLVFNSAERVFFGVATCPGLLVENGITVVVGTVDPWSGAGVSVDVGVPGEGSPA
jgi:hypothetical protein